MNHHFRFALTKYMSSTAHVRENEPNTVGTIELRLGFLVVVDERESSWSKASCLQASRNQVNCTPKDNAFVSSKHPLQIPRELWPVLWTPRYPDKWTEQCKRSITRFRTRWIYNFWSAITNPDRICQNTRGYFVELVVACTCNWFA